MILDRRVLKHMSLRGLQHCIDIVFDGLSVPVIQVNAMHLELRVAIYIALHTSTFCRKLKFKGSSYSTGIPKSGRVTSKKDRVSTSG